MTRHERAASANRCYVALKAFIERAGDAFCEGQFADANGFVKEAGKCIDRFHDDLMREWEADLLSRSEWPQ